MADDSLTLPATGFKVGVKKVGDISVERVLVVYADADDVIDVSEDTPLPVTGVFWQTTQPVSVSSLPLPSGAATAAKQDTLLSALGTPLQAGGFIGNTAFGAVQSGAWTVSVTGVSTETTLAAVLAKLSGDPATQTTLALILAKLIVAPATEATLAAILAKLVSAPSTEAKQDAIITALGSPLQEGGTVSVDVSTLATQATLAALVSANHTDLAALLAKLSNDPSTATLQTSSNTKLDTLAGHVDGLETLIGTSNTGLASILAKLSGDPATQTSLAALVSANHTDLAALLAKLSNDPSTATLQASANTKLDTLSAYVDGLEAGLASILAKLSGDPATQTSLAALVSANHTDLAAILAKLIAAPATEAKQDSGITQATASATVLGLSADAAVVTDANGTISAKLRGLVKRWADALGAGTAAAALRTTLASDDPAVAVLGATGDVAVAAGATGSISAKLRSLSRDIVANIVLATGTNIIGRFGIDQTTPGTTNKVIIGTAGADGSTTITTGGTAQSLFSAATPTNGFEICNPDATNDLWVSDSTTAAANNTGSFRVAANGGTYTTPGGYRPIQAVSIVGAVTGQKITARRW